MFKEVQRVQEDTNKGVIDSGQEGGECEVTGELSPQRGLDVHLADLGGRAPGRGSNWSRGWESLEYRTRGKSRRLLYATIRTGLDWTGIYEKPLEGFIQKTGLCDQVLQPS